MKGWNEGKGHERTIPREGANTRLFQQYDFVISADVKCFAKTVLAVALAYSCLYGLVLNPTMGSETCLPPAPYPYAWDWTTGTNAFFSVLLCSRVSKCQARSAFCLLVFCFLSPSLNWQACGWCWEVCCKVCLAFPNLWPLLSSSEILKRPQWMSSVNDRTLIADNYTPIL